LNSLACFSLGRAINRVDLGRWLVVRTQHDKSFGNLSACFARCAVLIIRR
jgi:hypothetical protein